MICKFCLKEFKPSKQFIKYCKPVCQKKGYRAYLVDYNDRYCEARRMRVAALKSLRPEELIDLVLGRKKL